MKEGRGGAVPVAWEELMCVPSLAIEMLRDFVVTAIAAFAGAWAVLIIETKRERRRQEDREYLALRFAHFATFAQLSELVNLSKALAPFQGRADAWRALHPLLAVFTTPRLAPNELAFVLESSNPNLLNRLTVGQQHFESIRSTMEARNELHLKMQQRIAELLARGISEMSSEDELERQIGKDIVKGLMAATSALFEGVDEAAKSLEKNLQDLQAFSKEYFPSRRVPGFRIDPVSG